jgi:amino acid adenylation domain-containing protein
MGDFSSVEILEVDRTEKESFIDRAKKIHKQLIADLDHRYFDGVAVFRELAKINADDFRKGVPVIFTSLLDHGFTESISQIGKIVDSVNQTAHVWCDLHVDEVKGALVVKFDAVDELFEASVLDDILASYINLLDKLVEQEDNWRNSDINFFPDAQAERRKKVNDTNTEFPDELLHTLFAKKVIEQPDSLAVLSNQKNLTFKELFELSNKIGSKLRKLGAEPNKLVAVVMEKGWEQVPAVYGILQAGSAYLPIDPDFPDERINQLLADGEVNIVLTQSWVKDNIEWPANVSCYCIDTDDFANEDNTPLEPVQKSSDLAYVLYTSGSTGSPKGVMIEHRSVVNRMLDVNGRYRINETDRAIGLTALQHDLSVYDVFGMLIAGGAIVIPDNQDRMDPAHWAQVIKNYGVTFWNSVPAFLEMYVDYLETNKSKDVVPENLRVVILSGDWIPVSLPDRLKTIVPKIKLIGSGGPTETTIWDIYNFIEKVDPNWKSIPYGKPMANAKYYVMKDNFEECPDYVKGELYIGGTGLARGFWKDEEKTIEKFVTHPKSGERLYRSGDLGSYLPDGNVMIAGRKDFQVKIRGLRVELGEIESILETSEEIKDVVVTAVGESQTNKRLIGYVVPATPFEEPSNDKPNVFEETNTDADQSDRDGSLLSDVEKMELKLKHLEIRQDDNDKKSVQLKKPQLNKRLKDKYLARQTYRTYLNGSTKIPLNKLSEFISCVAQLNLDELPFPKYRYPSAGSLYPVQVYLYIKPNAIEDLEGGTYYYNPKDHKLVLLNANAPIKKSVHTINNYQIFEDSAFSIFLVAQMSAIAPVYGTKTIAERVGKSTFKTMVSGAQTMLFRMKQNQSTADASREFCVLEAGYMGQLLMTSAQENNIGLAPTGGVDFKQIRKYFDLEDSHLYIHGFIGGPIDPSQTKRFSLLEEISSSSGAKDPKQEFIDEIKNYLQNKIPDYMVPANIVLLDQLPLTPNGKVDRKALPIPDDGTSSDFQEVRSVELSPSVDKISQIVGSVLKLDRINPSASLFNLGATSIQIIMMTNQFENKLGYRPRIDEIYADPTIAAIADKYDKVKGVDSGAHSEDEKADKTLELLEKVKALSDDEVKSQIN